MRRAGRSAEFTGRVSKLIDCVTSRSRAGGIRQTDLEASGERSRAAGRTDSDLPRYGLGIAGSTVITADAERQKSRSLANGLSAIARVFGGCSPRKFTGMRSNISNRGRRAALLPLAAKRGHLYMCAPIHGLATRGVRRCRDATGTRRGHGPRRPRVPGAGHCGDWLTRPEGADRGMPNSLWDCSNLRLAIAAELWRESHWHVERHGGCRAGVAGG